MRVITKAPAKITRATIEATWKQRGADQRLIVRDKECRGLALVVHPTTMTWVYSYRPRGIDPRTNRRWPGKTITLGNPETHSPEDARHAANKLKGQLKVGRDPAAERRSAIADAVRKRSTTLDRLLEDYAAGLPKRPKLRGSGPPSSAYVADELAQVLFALREMDAMTMPAASLGADDLRRLIDGGKGRARFGALSRFLDWCQDAGHIHTNPCLLIPRTRRPKAPPARSHYLAPAELACLWRAAESLQQSIWRDLARFLMAVPCRRGEAAQLDWVHVDLGAAEWRQPTHLTKNREPHRLHLHPLALDILRGRQAATGGRGLIFPSPRAGAVVDTWNALKAALSDAAGLHDWRWHDFRRSFATALGEAGISEVVVDGILNHRQSATRHGVLGVYQRASRWPEQVRAMQLWGRLLQAALDGREVGADVVATPAPPQLNRLSADSGRRAGRGAWPA